MSEVRDVPDWNPITIWEPIPVSHVVPPRGVHHIVAGSMHPGRATAAHQGAAININIEVKESESR